MPKEKGIACCSQRKTSPRNNLLITSVFVFLCVCLKGEGHKEDEDGGRVKRDGFNVATTVVRWQLGCNSAIVQSCLYKVGQKHMTCTSDSQSSTMNHENNMAARPGKHSLFRVLGYFQGSMIICDDKNVANVSAASFILQSYNKLSAVASPVIKNMAP